MELKIKKQEITGRGQRVNDVIGMGEREVLLPSKLKMEICRRKVRYLMSLFFDCRTCALLFCCRLYVLGKSSKYLQFYSRIDNVWAHLLKSLPIILYPLSLVMLVLPMIR